MNSPNELKEITRFLLEYANRLMGSGVHTSRVIRNTRRIGKSLDVDVKMSLFQKTMVVSVCDIDSTEVYNEVAIIPAFPISFELNAELSALSWEAYDNHLPLETLWDKYEKIISRPKMDPLCTLFLVGFANASFCALFGGDWTARLIVFSATLIGFYIKQIISFTIHPGIIEFKGQNYLFYHNAILTIDGKSGATGRRSVCVDYLYYLPDGRMAYVEQTKEGITVKPKTAAEVAEIVNPYTDEKEVVVEKEVIAD